jgi:hypothetical protein
MPSGSFLTALYNSLVLKLYKVMWFSHCSRKNNIKPLLSDFQKIVDYVYGDDTLTASSYLPEIYNAKSMSDYFELIGLGLTDSNKQKITKERMNVNDLTFLKRSFRFHPEIGKVMCPLDLNTVFSSLSFYDKAKDMNVVIKDKLHAFQREIYLHYDLYPDLLAKLQYACATRGIDLDVLPKTYLKHLYCNEPDKLFDMTFSKYI